jgi:hypothetical protein
MEYFITEASLWDQCACYTLDDMCLTLVLIVLPAKLGFITQFQRYVCCLLPLCLLAGFSTIRLWVSSILRKDMECTLYASSPVSHISLLEQVLGWRFCLYGDFLVISFVNCTWTFLIWRLPFLVPCYWTLDPTSDCTAAVHTYSSMVRLFSDNISVIFVLALISQQKLPSELLWTLGSNV